jgi:hypothetical protein
VKKLLDIDSRDLIPASRKEHDGDSSGEKTIREIERLTMQEGRPALEALADWVAASAKEDIVFA